ncbi:MAG TPA: hypothetical protein VG916_00610 [Gemmatimonadaceae bacterium]|nr:hypothetical protein [Gemmatimonadaceae bacterium]
MFAASMYRMNRFARSLAVALAVFQAAAPSVASLADSTVGTRSAVATHIEDHTRRSCVPVHPDNCALCRVLSLAAAPAGASASSIATRRIAGAHIATACETPASPDVRLQHSRAPPAA